MYTYVHQRHRSSYGLFVTIELRILSFKKIRDMKFDYYLRCVTVVLTRKIDLIDLIYCV